MDSTGQYHEPKAIAMAWSQEMWVSTGISGGRAGPVAAAHGRMVHAGGGGIVRNADRTYESRRRQPVPVRSGGEYEASYGLWTSGHWWATWMRREIRELGLGETENGKVLGAPYASRKRAKRGSTGARDFRFDPEEVGDSGDSGGIAWAGCG